MSELLLDRAGRRRSPATLPGFHTGHAPGNKGLRYPADPAKVEEIVVRRAGSRAEQALSIWQAGVSVAGGWSCARALERSSYPRRPNVHGGTVRFPLTRTKGTGAR